MTRTRAGLLATLLAVSGLAVSMLRRQWRPLPAHPGRFAPEECRNLARCAMGCYKGPAYCAGVCTANAGGAICSHDYCMGQEICAMPDYDPLLAFERLSAIEREATQKQRWKWLIRELLGD